MGANDPLGCAVSFGGEEEVVRHVGIRARQKAQKQNPLATPETNDRQPGNTMAQEISLRKGQPATPQERNPVSLRMDLPPSFGR